MLEVVKLYNATKDVSFYCTVASSYMSRFFGLRFKRRQNMFFEFSKPSRVFIDMWGVLFPIKLVGLGLEGEVTQVKERVNPFSVCWLKGKHLSFIELPLSNNVPIDKGDIIRQWRKDDE